MKDVKFEIVERIGTIRDGSYPVRLNLVSWNGGKPRFDLRRWKAGEDDAELPLRGMTLDTYELRALRDILNGMEVLADE